jgi:hypothetical protein
MNRELKKRAKKKWKFIREKDRMSRTRTSVRTSEHPDNRYISVAIHFIWNVAKQNENPRWLSLSLSLSLSRSGNLSFRASVTKDNFFRWRSLQRSPTDFICQQFSYTYTLPFQYIARINANTFLQTRAHYAPRLCFSLTSGTHECTPFGSCISIARCWICLFVDSSIRCAPLDDLLRS